MQFLKSLFCLQGFDNRQRFSAICSAIYVIFIMLISAFSGKVIISIVILLFLTPILTLSTLRRLKDTKLNKRWFIVPNILFVLAALIIIFSEHHSSYYLLFIPFLCSAVLLTYPSIRKPNSVNQHYILGYYGPVDMSEYQQASHPNLQGHSRIEPTLMGSHSVNVGYQEHNSTSQSQWESNELISPDEDRKQDDDLGEVIRLNLLNNRKIQLSIVVIMTIIVLTAITSWLMTPSPENIPTQTTQKSAESNSSEQNVFTRQYPLPMPDNFTLYLSQHKGLIINWQADEVSSSLLWSQSSAKGEASCQQIVFNKGKPIRTLMVQVEGSSKTDTDNSIYTDYFASFSPLDSKALIQALAFRGSFSLCGYDFSLKGSQAALGQNMQYAEWVDY